MSAGPLNAVSPGAGPPGAGPLDHGALAAAVRSKVPTLGTFIGAASPVAAEVCAAAGVDWVLLDLEHGAGGEEQVRDVVPAAGSCGLLVTDGAAAARGLEQGWSFVAIGSDTTLLASAVSAEFGRARTSSKPR